MLWVNGRSQLLAQLLRAMPSDVHGDFGPHFLLENEMNAAELTSMLKFKSGMPYMVLRNNEGGRIAVYSDGKRIATAGPGEMLGDDSEAFLLSYPNSVFEYRCSWQQVATALSLLQQTGYWDEVDIFFDEVVFNDFTTIGESES